MTHLNRTLILAIAVLTVLAAMPVEAKKKKNDQPAPVPAATSAASAGVPYICVPSCDDDGRMIGSTGDFANFSLLGELSDPKSVLVMRLWVQSGGSLQVGVFDPDHRGRRLGKAGVTPFQEALWDNDIDKNRQPSTVPLRYRLCVQDPANEFKCLGSIQAETSTGLAAFDDRWFDFNQVPASGSDKFYLLEISLDLTQQPGESDAAFKQRIRDTLASGWSMFKVRARAVTASGIKSPMTLFIPAYLGARNRPQVLGFGVPLTSFAEFDKLYPSGGGTTYDGTWQFPAVQAPSYVGYDTTEIFRVLDGDWDFGTADNASTGAVSCPGADPSLRARFDSDDPNTGAFPTAFLDSIGCGPTDPACTTNQILTAAGAVGLLGEKSGLVEQPGGPCFSLAAPHDDYPASGDVFKRVPLRSDWMNLAYSVTDRRNNEFVNLNPSGNQEFEQFDINGALSCLLPPVGSDDACAAPLLDGLYRVSVEGMDVLNLNHVILPVCYQGNNADCLPELCKDGRKPNFLLLEYDPVACPANSVTDPLNSQTADTCFGGDPSPNGEARRIRARQPGDPSRKPIWFDGVVEPGESFVVAAANIGRGNFQGGNLVVEILEGPNSSCTQSGGGSGCLQRIEFHISCSQPINIGDVFGSTLIVAGLSE